MLAGQSQLPACTWGWPVRGAFLSGDFSVAVMLLMSHKKCAGITDAPLYKKTDKSKPMGANVALSNAIGSQPTERGASPILYAAACEDLAGVAP